MSALEYYSDVQGGQLQIGVRKLIAKELNHFNGKRVRIRIDKFSGKRSLQQNNLWHAYIGLLAPELGYEFEELKDVLNWKYLRKEVVDKNTGEVGFKIISSSELNKSEFCELLDKLIRHFAEDGIILPQADPNYKDDPQHEENWKITHS